MLTIIGIAFAFASVLVGFVWEGGKPLALFVPAEYLIIAGCALGTLVAMSPPRVLKRMMAGMRTLMTGDRSSKKQYQDLLTMLYEFFQLAKKDGLVGLEAHIEDPKQSAIFTKYPHFLADERALSFLCDSMKVIIASGVPPHDLESLLDVDIETRRDEESEPVGILQKVGDSLPGLGIVAAVLGIVITMGAIDGPPEEIGHKVAAALVGTFLGILLSYGMVQPMATNLELLNQNEARLYHVMKAALVAFWKHMPTMTVIEFARRTIPTDLRPSFNEMEDACRQRPQ